MATLYNLELEQNYIAGILQYPDAYVETDYVKTSDLSKVNGDILGVIQNIIETGGHPTPVVIADKCKNLSISIDGIDIKDFCDSLMVRAQSMDRRGIASIAKEIKKKAFVRKVHGNADKLKKEIIENQNESAKDLARVVDKYLGESLMNLGAEDSTAKNFLELLPDVIEEYGNSPDKSNDIIMPHESFRKCLGNLKPQNLYMVTARAGGAKSTFLLDLMRKIPDANPNKPELKILYLDTEMAVEDAIVRYIAGAIGVPYWLVDNRQWRKDTIWCPKIRAELDRIRGKKNKNLFFDQIGNKSAIDLERYIKNFYLQKVGRGNPFLVLYDYLKISEGDKTEKNQQEYIIAYNKSEALKEVAEYCNCPIFKAIQANRSGIVNGRNASQLDDSENSGSMSDRLNWLVAFNGILRKRTHDEILLDSMPNLRAPSHKLIATKTRYLGENGPAFLDFIKVKTGATVSYKPNFINLDIDNFNVVDKGTYAEWLILQGKTKLANDKKQDDSPL